MRIKIAGKDFGKVMEGYGDAEGFGGKKPPPEVADYKTIQGWATRHDPGTIYRVEKLMILAYPANIPYVSFPGSAVDPNDPAEDILRIFPPKGTEIKIKGSGFGARARVILLPLEKVMTIAVEAHIYRVTSLRIKHIPRKCWILFIKEGSEGSDGGYR